MVDDQVSSCEQGTLCDCMELVLHNHSYCNLWLPYKQHKCTKLCTACRRPLCWCVMYHVTTPCDFTCHVTSHDVSCDFTCHVTSHDVMWPHMMCHVTTHDVSCDHTCVMWPHMMCHVTTHDVSCDLTRCVMWPHTMCHVTSLAYSHAVYFCSMQSAGLEQKCTQWW